MTVSVGSLAAPGGSWAHGKPSRAGCLKKKVTQETRDDALRFFDFSQKCLDVSGSPRMYGPRKTVFKGRRVLAADVQRLFVPKRTLSITFTDKHVTLITI